MAWNRRVRSKPVLLFLFVGSLLFLNSYNGYENPILVPDRIELKQDLIVSEEPNKIDPNPKTEPQASTFEINWSKWLGLNRDGAPVKLQTLRDGSIVFIAGIAANRLIFTAISSDGEVVYETLEYTPEGYEFMPLYVDSFILSASEEYLFFAGHIRLGEEEDEYNRPFILKLTVDLLFLEEYVFEMASLTNPMDIINIQSNYNGSRVYVLMENKNGTGQEFQMKFFDENLNPETIFFPQITASPSGHLIQKFLMTPEESYLYITGDRETGENDSIFIEMYNITNANWTLQSYNNFSTPQEDMHMADIYISETRKLFALFYYSAHDGVPVRSAIMKLDCNGSLLWSNPTIIGELYFGQYIFASFSDQVIVGGVHVGAAEPILDQLFLAKYDCSGTEGVFLHELKWASDITSITILFDMVASWDEKYIYTSVFTTEIFQDPYLIYQAYDADVNYDFNQDFNFVGLEDGGGVNGKLTGVYFLAKNYTGQITGVTLEITSLTNSSNFIKGINMDVKPDDLFYYSWQHPWWEDGPVQLHAVVHSILAFPFKNRTIVVTIDHVTPRIDLERSAIFNQTSLSLGIGYDSFSVSFTDIYGSDPFNHPVTEQTASGIKNCTIEILDGFWMTFLGNSEYQTSVTANPHYDRYSFDFTVFVTKNVEEFALIELKFCDMAGNVNTSWVYIFVDNISPEVSLVGDTPPNWISSPEFELEFHFSDQSNLFTYDIDYTKNLLNYSILEVNNTNVIISGKVQFINSLVSINFTCTDSAGNSQKLDLLFRLDLHDPEFVSTRVPNRLYKTKTFELRVSVKDLEHNINHVRVQIGNGSWMNLSYFFQNIDESLVYGIDLNMGGYDLGNQKIRIMVEDNAGRFQIYSKDIQIMYRELTFLEEYGLYLVIGVIVAALAIGYVLQEKWQFWQIKKARLRNIETLSQDIYRIRYHGKEEISDNDVTGMKGAKLSRSSKLKKQEGIEPKRFDITKIQLSEETQYLLEFERREKFLNQFIYELEQLLEERSRQK